MSKYTSLRYRFQIEIYLTLQYKGHAILTGSIIIRKLGAESEGHIGKYSFVNTTIKLWNQLLADARGILSHFKRRFRKVINETM
jgi:hypothetical protein